MRDGTPFAFAALWERWTVRGDAVLRGSLAALGPGDVLDTITILTVNANAAVTPLHDRMPVILPPERFEPWLAGEDVPLDPCPPESTTVHPVSTHVNRTANDDPRCIEPVTPA